MMKIIPINTNIYVSLTIKIHISKLTEGLDFNNHNQLRTPMIHRNSIKTNYSKVIFIIMELRTIIMSIMLSIIIAMIKTICKIQ
jgi:hypothetical protein